MKIKDYFLFDDEPISGGVYLIRSIISSILFFILIGIWIDAATVYKRSGAFNWSKETRTILSIGIPLVTIINAILNDLDTTSISPTFMIIIYLTIILHFILIFKNGNKDFLD